MDKILTPIQGIIVSLLLALPLFIPIIFNKLFTKENGIMFMRGGIFGIIVMYLACKVAGL